MKPKPNDPPADLQQQVDRALAAGGLDQLGTRELLSVLLSCLFHAERRSHLEQTAGDKGNGTYDRMVNVGSLPVDVDVPRTRIGDFRPSQLPPPYQRGYGDAARDLLVQLVAASRSMGAARQALHGMGLAVSDGPSTVSPDTSSRSSSCATPGPSTPTCSPCSSMASTSRSAKVIASDPPAFTWRSA